MALTDRKITTYAANIKNLSDTPNQDGVTAEQLKALFDGRTDAEVKTMHNGLIDDLVAVTDGASGADQIGATPLKIGGSAKVQGQLEALEAEKVGNTGDETISGIKTFSSSPAIPTPTTAMQAATKGYVDNTTVGIAGDETITGVKTFSSSPIVPEPTTPTQAATKKYVDETVSNVVLGQIPDNALTNAKLGLDVKVGSLQELTTTEKASVTKAINEVNAKNGSDIIATGYAKASTPDAVAATDTLNQAVGKLEKQIEDKQSAPSSYNVIAYRSIGGAL